MMLISSLPFNRQSKPVRQQILADIRSLLLRHKATYDLPRIRLRSLDVIPLSLSLPRHSSLTDVTRTLNPHASISSWTCLSPTLSHSSPLTSPLLRSLRAFFSSSISSRSAVKLPPLLTWNPSSLKTIHQQPSQKMNHILKLSTRHICFLQETQWTSVQYNHLLSQSPFCTIVHAPAIADTSSGVAILLPRTITASGSVIVEPGYILSVSFPMNGLLVELINVYLHPCHVLPLAKKLLKHLRTDASRSHHIRILGGDFNQLHTKPVFQDFLTELDATNPPLHPTFRKSCGYSSPLDFFLLQLLPSFTTTSPPKYVTFWPEYQPTGHGIHICKFPRTPPVASQPDDTLAATIPTSAFYSPPSQSLTSSPSPPTNIASLSRSLRQLGSPSLLRVKATFWHWWRTQKGCFNNLTNAPHHKYLHILQSLLRAPSSHLVQVPCPCWNWLVSQFPSFTVPSFPILHDRFVLIPLHYLSQLINQYQISHTRLYRPIRSSQFTSPPTHTWHKCRFAAPKIARHTGVIRSASGDICTTTTQLDSALRATRAFWSDFPPPTSPHWSSLLYQYSTACSPFPFCSPPSIDDIYHSIITSPDSAPGADGLPYAAWRVNPDTSSQCLYTHFQDIIFRNVTPPHQSLVFIPKADQGEYADNYRPLGLPNTSDRIIDRAAYSKFCETLLNALHPAQALLNAFREPQFNYLEVQDFLNTSHDQKAVLLSDLAKAFERVNPHWIIHVLIRRGVAYWVLNYCRHILFGRKVLHKIHSTYRPPLAIHNGVDMGRAFSVLLFCVAMDPWYYHVHQIPRVLINRGYMDDNATGGDGLSWLSPAQNLFQKFADAGFVVLSHHCYKVELLPPPAYETPSFFTCDHITDGYPSFAASLPNPPISSYLRLSSGSRCVVLHSSLLSFSPFLHCPTFPHILPFLHTAPCQCKCKTFLIPNFPLTSPDLCYLDSTPWGSKIISPSATMLGLFLHSPYTQVTTLYDEQMNPLPPTSPFTRKDIEAAQLRKPITVMQKRTRACSALGLSFRDRTLFLSFYVLSLPVYHHSTLLPSSPFYRIYYSLIRRLLAPRHWIQASHLPGIVTYLRLGTLHCPVIHLTCSLLGYCLRCYGETVASWLCFVTPSLPLMPPQLSAGLSHVRNTLLAANSYNPESFIYLLQKLLYQNHSSYKLSHLVLAQVKIHLRNQLMFNTLTFLRERLSQVDWAFSSSSATLEAVHSSPLKAIPPFSRLAILRWIIDSEADVHFRLRPHITRTSPCRCGCGQLSSLFPYGLKHGSVHYSHFLYGLTWTLSSPTSLIDLYPHFYTQVHPSLPPLTLPPRWYTRKNVELATLDSLPAPLVCWLSHPCVLCGGGDNSVQHWLTFCPVPALAGSLLLNRPWRTSYWYFTLFNSLGRRALISSLWVATRQFVHERSGLPPPSLLPPTASTLQISSLPRSLAERAFSLLPQVFHSSTSFRPSSPLTPKSSNSCTFHHLHFPTLSLEAEGHPHFYGPAPSISTTCSADDLIGVFSPSSPIIKKLFAFQKVMSRPPNCTLEFKLCSCGSIHGYLRALLPLSPGTPLFIGDPETSHNDLVLHFDGGAFRELQIGGAGVAVWKHTAGTLTLLETLCVPIYPCSDATHAEACGAGHAVVLAAKYFAEIRPRRIVIKGDNRPVIDFFNNLGKLRRADLQHLLDEAQHHLAFSLPPIVWSYTPREFNRCADFLAGIARDTVREHFAHSPDSLPSLSPFTFPLNPSLSSLFSPVCNTPIPSTSSHFTFQECPAIDPSFMPLLFRHYKETPSILRYLRALSNVHSCTLQPLSVLYRPSGSDHHGRLYCSHLGAQKLPKTLRYVIFGRTHHEIDLTGSHYQLFSRLAASLRQTSLPSVASLRSLLSDDMSSSPSQLLSRSPSSPKDLPTILLNSTLGDTIAHYNALGYYPSPSVLEALRSIQRAKPLVLDAIEQQFGKRTLDSLTLTNRPFHVLEHVETIWLKHFVTFICQHDNIDSLIWLHDGVWLSPHPSPTLLIAANLHASRSLGLDTPLLLKSTPLLSYAIAAETDLLAGRPPPSFDPKPVLRLGRPSLSSPLSEPVAQAAFLRMMARTARTPFPPEVIAIDP